MWEVVAQERKNLKWSVWMKKKGRCLNASITENKRKSQSLAEEIEEILDEEVRDKERSGLIKRIR